MNDKKLLTVDEAIRALLSEEEGLHGRIQIVCLPFGHWTDRVGTFFAHLLCFFKDGERVFERLRVVAPPGTDPNGARARLAEATDAAMLRGGAEPDKGRPERLEDRIDLVVSGDLSTETVLRLAAGAPDDQAVVVACAADYRVPGLVNAAPPGTAAIIGSDETWAPHLCWIAAKLAESDVEGERFAILDTNKFRPSDEQLEALRAVHGCAVLTGTPEDPESEVDARLPQWRAWIGEGSIGRALQELDAIEGLGEDGRRAVRIQLMDTAGMTPQALAELHILRAANNLPPSMSAKLARIAAEAGASRLAIELLSPVAERLIGREDLQNALRAAERADDANLTRIVADALARFFPESTALRSHRYREALSAGDHAAAATFVPLGSEGEEAASYHRTLAAAFDVDVGLPDYQALIDAYHDDAERSARIIAACAADALRRHALVHAFELSVEPRAAKAKMGSQTLLSTVEQLLINRPGGVTAVPTDRIVDAVAILIGRLASNPANTALRSALIDLLDVAVAGDEGLPIALSLLLTAASAPLDPTPARDLPDAPPFDQLLRDPAFREPMTRWIEEETPIHVGHTPFPVEQLTISPDEACSSILCYLGDAAEQGVAAEAGGDGEVPTIVLALGTAIARHASDRDVDIKMICTTAIGMAIGGARQPARDLAETMLIRPDTPRRRRLAWFGMADVYHRCGDRLLSALYAAAGLMADTSVNEDQLWHETLVIFRILRDNGLTPHALSVLDVAERVLERMGRAGRYGHRIETMRLQTRLSLISAAEDRAAEVSAMLRAAVANARVVVDRRDTTAPAASLIAHLNRFARELGLPPDAEAIAVEAELRAPLSGGVAQQVDVSGRDVPTREDLLALLVAPQPARYSEDVGKDALAATMAARRALDSDQTLRDPLTACLAIEICCDRAIASPGWDGARLPPQPPAGAGGPAKVAAALSGSDVAVVHAAFGHNGRLVKVVARGGSLVAAREPETSITLARLTAWSARYPFAYGTAEKDVNRFFTSTESLSLSDVGGGATLIVGDKHLRSFPPNLLRIGDRFAGEVQPMAAAPSLTWLHAAVVAPRLGDGRRMAWISGAETGGTTLATLGDRTEATLAAHRFSLSRERALPVGFVGASMAVVAAHGGLNRNSNAFQVVSDEGSLVVTADSLGTALHNVGVVILFVCSGGRSDAHPSADATLGLARQVLDQGAQAVIASPWPLESIVPPPWLEAFLQRWDAHDTLIDAVHTANRRMLERWPHDYAKGLAMNVLGNPLLQNDH